jgi:Ni,Fe-hydrogenase maturation factor
MKLMNVYSRQVASGAWKDYAIDHLDGMAMFSIFRSTHETPLFTVIKLGSEHKNAGQYIALHSGERIKQSSELANVLESVEKRARKVVPLFKTNS